MNVDIMECASIRVRILGDRSNVYVRKDTSLHQIDALVMVSVFVSIVSSFSFIYCVLFISTLRFFETRGLRSIFQWTEYFQIYTKSTSHNSLFLCRLSCFYAIANKSANNQSFWTKLPDNADLGYKSWVVYGVCVY